jgi:hypothetical protein
VGEPDCVLSDSFSSNVSFLAVVADLATSACRILISSGMSSLLFLGALRRNSKLSSEGFLEIFLIGLYSMKCPEAIACA